jgi:TonB family protein
MPHALLLSPDDQAVAAITGVLEEMSVTCERPLDGVSAAQMLNAQSFDLVLVDCENLPAAKLIFDVCRKGNNGHNPVPIAIVDGRVGLPTAFRLGAELILTKPVAKDQARSTIRTAVSRVRRDAPAYESVSVQPASAVSAVEASVVNTEVRAMAAAAASSQGSAPAVTTTMHSAVEEAEEIDAAPATPSSENASASFGTSGTSTLSEDPVLAEPKTAEVEAEPSETQQKILEPAKAKLAQPAAKSSAAFVPSHQPRPQQASGAQVALLALVMAGGGFYGAWLYQPGFRAAVHPQIDRVLTLVGMALPPASKPTPAKPTARPVPVQVAAPAPAPASTTNANPTQSTNPTGDSAKNAVPASPTGAGNGSAAGITPPSAAAAALPATPGKVVAPPASGNGNTPAAAPVVKQPEVVKPSASKPSVGKANVSKTSVTKKDTGATAPSDTPLPTENGVIVLSSKGAEKRLTYSIAPRYPAEARAEGAEGTVVLKAVVDENGKVKDLRVVEGNTTLATAAIQAVKQWRYQPFLRDEKAQPFQTVVIVDFQRP